MSAPYLQLQPRRPGGIKVQLCRRRIFSRAGRTDRAENPLCFDPSPSPGFFRLPIMHLWFQIQASLKPKDKAQKSLSVQTDIEKNETNAWGMFFKEKI